MVLSERVQHAGNRLDLGRIGSLASAVMFRRSKNGLEGRSQSTFPVGCFSFRIYCVGRHAN